MRAPPSVSLLSLLMLCAVVCAVACVPPTAPPTPEMDSRVVVDERGVVPALVCPGVPGCESNDAPLLAGAGLRAFTPDVGPGFAPVYLAGFGMGRQATEVHDDVWARAVVLSQGDVRVGVVILDAVGFFHDGAVEVRQRAAAAGLDLDHVVVASTHTHESKDTMGMWGKDAGTSGFDPEYHARIIDGVVESLADAVAGLVPVRVHLGLAQAPDLVRDSRDPSVIDQSLHVIDLRRTSDDTSVATLTVWGNHPEALGADNTALTSDYPHYLRSAVERGRPGTVSLALNGILGGLTTMIGRVICPSAADANLDDCPQGTFERAERVGEVAGASALAALDDDAVVLDAPALSFRRQPVMLTPTSFGLAAAFQIGLVHRPVFDKETGERIPDDSVPFLELDDLQQGVVQIDSEVSALSLGDLEIVFVPGELYAELWLINEDGSALLERPANADYPDAPLETPIQAVMPPLPDGTSFDEGRRLRAIVNQASDSIGYIIPKAQWDLSAPYAYDPDGQYGEVNSIGENAAPEVCGAVKDMYRLRAR